MNINDLVIPEGINNEIDKSKNRCELILDGENSGRIIGYYPIENLQVYVYEINGSQLPDMRDLGLRMDFSDRYLRMLICRRGHGEFTENGINLNLSGGEFSIKSGGEGENSFVFTGDSLLGVEIVLQVDEAVDESILLKMLGTTMRSMGFRHDDFLTDQWYFSNLTDESEIVIDHLIDNCFNRADSAIIMINAAEIGYILAKEYKGSESKERKYPTNPQRAIAEDMHRQLTENYSERITAALFAEKYSMSDTTVKNYFKSVYGYSFKEYQMKVRMEKAAELLENSRMKIVEIAVAVGYATQAKFIEAFKKHYHMTPSKYRQSKRLGDILSS